MYPSTPSMERKIRLSVPGSLRHLCHAGAVSVYLRLKFSNLQRSTENLSWTITYFRSGSRCAGPRDCSDDETESSADSDIAEELFQDYFSGVPWLSIKDYKDFDGNPRSVHIYIHISHRLFRYVPCMLQTVRLNQRKGQAGLPPWFARFEKKDAR